MKVYLLYSVIGQPLLQGIYASVERAKTDIDRDPGQWSTSNRYGEIWTTDRRWMIEPKDVIGAEEDQS